MAAAACRLQWLLLLASFSAVLRPTWTNQLNQIDHEGTWIGFRQPDGAGRASSVRGLSFPVWSLLVHYGTIEKLAGRSAIRRIRSTGAHQPARHLLLSHGMITMQTPFEFLISERTTAMRVFLGAGLYFLILLLACHDVERHPGPEFSEMDKLFLKNLVQFPGLMKSTIVLEDLIPVVFELGRDIENCSKKITALEAENSRLVSRVQELEKCNLSQDKEQRRKNVVVFGVPTKTDLNKAVDDILFQKLSLKRSSPENVIENVYRFGKDTPQRPILIRFKSESDKKCALSRAPKLRNTDIKISDDLTSAERLNRRKVVEAHKAARTEGIETKVVRQGLLINGKILPPSELENIDWMEKYVEEKDCAASSKPNETTPRANVTPTKDCPGAPVKKTKQR